MSLGRRPLHVLLFLFVLVLLVALPRIGGLRGGAVEADQQTCEDDAPHDSFVHDAIPFLIQQV
jgi:hypothetical protein